MDASEFFGAMSISGEAEPPANENVDPFLRADTALESVASHTYTNS